MKTFKSLFLITALWGAGAFAAPVEMLDGVYQGYGFTVAVAKRDTATLEWHDGYPGFSGIYNARPVPRAPLPLREVYQAGVRRILVELDPVTGRYIGVHFDKLGQ